MLTNRNYLYFFLFVIALFLILIGPNLFTDGMFLDGVTYAAISKNMAHGTGSFWAPHLSYGLFPEFYEHPPLALGLQSIWFRLLGDSILIERFYSLTTYILTGILVALIWKEQTKNIRTAWIPLLFWITVSNVPWACTNNILENTMAVFICLSAWLYFKSWKKFSYVYILLSGMALSLAVLSKGLTALFIWAVPFFYWLFFRKESFFKMAGKSLLLICMTALPIALFYFFSEEASRSLTNYFTKQVIRNSQNEMTVNTRFAIIGDFFQLALPPLAIAIILIGLSYKRRIQLGRLKDNYRTALFYLCITLSGVLPIMISIKQSSFYIIPVFPFFAIGLGYLLLPIIEKLTGNLQLNLKWFKIFRLSAYVLLLLGLSITIFRMNTISRDKNKIEDCYTVINTIGPHQSINICQNIYRDWSLHSYYARYGEISLVPDSIGSYKYFLTNKSCNNVSPDRYSEIKLNLREYGLYLKKEKP